MRQSDGTANRCFNPRHGIRVTHAGVTTDFIICFECRQVAMHGPGDSSDHFLVSHSPQPVFDEVLTAAGVPLPPRE